MSYTLRVNGKTLNNINGKLIKNLVYKGVYYSIVYNNEEPIDETIISFQPTTDGETFKISFNKLDTEVTEIYLNDELISNVTAEGTNEVELGTLNTDIYTIKLSGAGKIETVDGGFLFSINTTDNSLTAKTAYISSVVFGNNYGQYIGTNSFKSSIITKIILSSSLITIGNQAFSGCTGLTSVTCNKGLKTIGAQAFDGCTALTSLSLNEGLETIGKSAFNTCPIPSINFPSSVVSIGQSAFAGSIAQNATIYLTSLTFNQPEGVAITFGSGVFKLKKASPVTIYHYGNESVLNYKWSGDNITATFVDLRGE